VKSQQEAEADSLTIKFVKGLQMEEALPSIGSFMLRLETQAAVTPNLLQARFGCSLTSHSGIVQSLDGQDSSGAQVPLNVVISKDKYAIDISDDQLVELSGHGGRRLGGDDRR
jgi:hypothetical protein